MKIYTIKATTGYTGLPVSLNKTVASEKALNDCAEKAFEIYKSKVAADPERLCKHVLRLCIWEQEPDENDIFRTVRLIYKDYRLTNGQMEMFYEWHRENGIEKVVYQK